MGPSDDRYVNDNLLIDMMLQGANARLCRRRGQLRRLRRGNRAPHAVRSDRREVQQRLGDRRRDRLQHGLHVDVSLQPVLVPWTNSLFENAPADGPGRPRALGSDGLAGEKPLWCIGGDGAMFDIGFQSLSRMIASGANIKVFVLDTQVYSNTGGQASTSSYTGQNTKMSVHGKAIAGKQERRKEIAQIAMMHPRSFVAQTTCAHVNHFYKSVIDALEFDGPALVCCYTTCQPEHGVADNMATEPSPARRRYAGVPAADLRSAQGKHHQASGCRCKAIRRSTTTGGNPKTGETGRFHRLSQRRAQRRESVADAADGARRSFGKLAAAAGTRRAAINFANARESFRTPLAPRRGPRGDQRSAADSLFQIVRRRRQVLPPSPSTVREADSSATLQVPEPSGGCTPLQDPSSPPASSD
jgi:pyruvate/2-oxoacid:ferredoxin oxidoreductase beta subunit